MIDIIAKLVAAVAPGFSLLVYFYLKDAREPEPLYLVMKMFLFGGLVVFPMIVLQQTFNPFLQGTMAQSFIATALFEEFIKWFLLYTLILKHVEFDEPYDGIVYAVAVAVGYATVENVFYIFLAKGDVATLIWTRALLPVSAHALFGVTMGYYFAKMKVRMRKSDTFASLILPVLFHGAFNSLSYLSTLYTTSFIVLYMCFLWIYGVMKMNSILKGV